MEDRGGGGEEGFIKRKRKRKRKRREKRENGLKIIGIEIPKRLAYVGRWKGEIRRLRSLISYLYSFFFFLSNWPTIILVAMYR